MTAHRYERIPEWTRGDRLRKARLLLDQSTKEFAETIGVSQKTVNNAESDAHEVRKIVMRAWAMATGVSLEWLETGQTEGSGGPDPQPSRRPGASGDKLAALTARKRRATRAGVSTDGYPSAA